MKRKRSLGGFSYRTKDRSSAFTRSPPLRSTFQHALMTYAKERWIFKDFESIIIRLYSLFNRNSVVNGRSSIQRGKFRFRSRKNNSFRSGNLSLCGATPHVHIYVSMPCTYYCRSCCEKERKGKNVLIKRIKPNKTSFRIREKNR